MSTAVPSSSSWPDPNHLGPLVLTNAFTLAKSSEGLSWQPFRPGVEICRLYGDGQDGPSAALLRYEPGATVPHHEHTGFEHIVVLSGAQSDQHGTYHAGAVVINPPGTHHAVASEEGCIVLIVWEKPVKMQAI